MGSNNNISNNNLSINFLKNLKSGKKVDAFVESQDKMMASIFDKNKDGVISQSELQSMISQINKDGNSEITNDELKKFIEANKAQLTQNGQTIDADDLKTFLGIKYNLTESPIFGNSDIGNSQALSKYQKDSKSENVKDICNDIYNGASGANGLREYRIKKGIEGITSQNAADVIVQFRQASGEKGIATVISEEITMNGDKQTEYINNIQQCLKARCAELGIDTSNLDQEWTRLNNSNTVFFSGNEKDKVLDQYAEKIRGHERQAGVDSTNTAQTATARLNSDIKEAQDNWAAEYSNRGAAKSIADAWGRDVSSPIKHAISSMTDKVDWDDKNSYSDAVWNDINNLKITTQNLENIRTTQGQKAFEAAFEKEFGVKYDEKAIQHYEEIAETRNTVKGLKASIDEISNSSSIRQLEMLSRTSKHYGDAPELEMKKQTAYLGAYQDFMRSLPADARNNPELVQLSNYSVQNFEKLKTVINEYKNQCNLQMQAIMGGRTEEEYEFDCKNAAKAAFGEKGDILERVNKYRESQARSSAIVKGVAKAAIVAAVGAATGGLGLVGAGVTGFGASATVETYDAYTRKALDVDTAMNILRVSTADGLMAMGGAGLGKALASYDAFIKFPGAVAGNTIIGAGGEYMKTGKITVQGTVINAVFSASGQLVSVVGLPKEIGKFTNTSGKETAKGTT